MFFDFRYIIRLFPQIIQALPISLCIVFISTAGGFLLGAGLAYIRLEKVPILQTVSKFYTSFIQGTPVIVQLFIVYYGIPSLLEMVGVDLSQVNKLVFMYIAYSLNTAAFASEIIRSAIGTIPRHQFEAAYSIGLSKWQTYKQYIIPQTLQIMLPNFEVTVVSLLQNSALATYLGIFDIMGRAQQVGANTSHQIEAYIVAAIIFLILSILIHVTFKFYQNTYFKFAITTNQKREVIL